MIGDKLKQARIAAGLTQQQVATILGIDRSAYTYYETGKTDISTKRLLLLSKLFGINADDLLNDSGAVNFECTNPLVKPIPESESEKVCNVLAVSAEERELLAKVRLIRGMGKGQHLDELLLKLCTDEEE